MLHSSNNFTNSLSRLSTLSLCSFQFSLINDNNLNCKSVFKLFHHHGYKRKPICCIIALRYSLFLRRSFEYVMNSNLSQNNNCEFKFLWPLLFGTLSMLYNITTSHFQWIKAIAICRKTVKYPENTPNKVEKQWYLVENQQEMWLVFIIMVWNERVHYFLFCV